MREPRTPEEERQWLLSKVNSQVNVGHRLWKLVLWLSALILLLAAVGLLPCLHFKSLLGLFVSL